MKNIFENLTHEEIKQKILSAQDSGKTLETLVYDLGLSVPRILYPEKYSNSTCDGKLIDKIEYYRCGVAIIITENNTHRFNINEEENPWPSADCILCELQNNPLIDVRK